MFAAMVIVFVSRGLSRFMRCLVVRNHGVPVPTLPLADVSLNVLWLHPERMGLCATVNKW